MKTYFTVTKKSLAAVFLFTLFVIIVSGRFYAAQNPGENARTNAMRASFIKSLNLIPDENNAEVKSITVPSEFSDVYESYNELQKQAGYDLKPFKGVKAKIYTYPVGKIVDDKNDEYYINLITYRGRIIGGDISSRSLDGEMFPLLRIE